MAALSAPTLQAMLLHVRTMLGQLDPQNSSWSDDELRRYINNGVQRYWGEVVQNSEGLFTTSTTLSTTANQETVALPATFFEVVRLWSKSGTNWIPLDYDQGRNTGFDETPVATGNGYRPYYYLRDNNLVLRPIPADTASNVLKLDYISWPDKMVALSDTMTASVAPVFEELVCAYAVFKAKVAESLRGHGINTYAPAEKLVADLYNQFREVIEGRSHSAQAIRPWNPGAD